MISAVTAQGLLLFFAYSGSFTSARFIEFCRKLLADTDRPVYLVVDGPTRHVNLLEDRPDDGGGDRVAESDQARPGW